MAPIAPNKWRFKVAPAFVVADPSLGRGVRFGATFFVAPNHETRQRAYATAELALNAPWVLAVATGVV